jgi:hypothetical protein
MFGALDYQSLWRRATVQRPMHETLFAGFTNFVSIGEFAIGRLVSHEKGGRTGRLSADRDRLSANVESPIRAPEGHPWLTYEPIGGVPVLIVRVWAASKRGRRNCAGGADCASNDSGRYFAWPKSVPVAMMAIVPV